LNPHSIIDAHILLNNEDLTSALEGARISHADAIGAPKIPNVTWDDVGGLSSVKSYIMDTIQLPLERPELFADGLKKRSGMDIPPHVFS
jgi:peroxin-6